MRRRLALFLALALAAPACATETAPTSTTAAPATTTTTRPVDTTTSTEVQATTLPPTTTTTSVPAVPLSSLPALNLVPIGGEFARPVFVGHRNGDDRLFVVNQNGLIESMTVDGEDRAVVIDLSRQVRFSGERGLLGLAFHPDDPERMFVHYTRRVEESTEVFEYRLPIDAVEADPDPVRHVLSHPQPEGNHNGGMIAFGPDGFLYLALGDGGGANDPLNQGQNPFTLLGAILRLDVDGGDPYAIPPDNPFADGEDGAPEVWAWGLRNPWRFSFDGDQMWIGDVGQGVREEIDVIPIAPGGLNMGWPVFEGTGCHLGPTAQCEEGDFVAPVHEYLHRSNRCSVTGGYVYRGQAHADLYGAYVFGDYCTGEVMAIRVQNGAVVDSRVFTTGLPLLTSFGVDGAGELYLTIDRSVYRLDFEG